MKVLFVAQNLNIGGVQTSLCNVCNTLIKNFPDIEIDIFSFGKGVMAEKISPEISINYGGYFLELLLTPFFEIKKERSFFALIMRYMLVVFAKIFGVKKLYSLLFRSQRARKEYDIAISYFNDVSGGYSNKGTNWYVDGFVKAKKKVAWIHTDPEKANFKRDDCLDAYKNFDRLVCVSNATKEKFNAFLPEFASKTCVVYNVFEAEKIQQLATEYVPFESKVRFNIISVGRNDNATKRFDKIIDICKRLKEDGISDFKWRVVGDGPDYEKNIENAQKAEVLDVLEFIESKANPYPYMKCSDLFVLTSDYEGYPMVLGESLILGIPVVTTDFAAAKEMISEGVNGYITEMDAESIYSAIRKIIENKEEYNLLAQNTKRLGVDHELCLNQLRKIIKG